VKEERDKGFALEAEKLYSLIKNDIKRV